MGKRVNGPKGGSIWGWHYAGHLPAISQQSKRRRPLTFRESTKAYST